MTPFARARANKRWAAVAALGILAISALEAYALSQGINGNALTGAMAAIATAGGTGQAIGYVVKGPQRRVYIEQHGLVGEGGHFTQQTD